MWNWINSYYDQALSCLCKGLQQQQLTSWVGQWNAGAALEPEWREAWWWCTWSPEPTTLQPKRQHGQHEPCMVSPITTALFVSLSLTLPGWIGNIGGLVNPRLEKMTWCITEAQHCCTPKLRYDECAFVAHDTDIYCIISKEKHTGRFFFFFWQSHLRYFCILFHISLLQHFLLCQTLSCCHCSPSFLLFPSQLIITCLYTCALFPWSST